MDVISVAEAAERWGVSARMVRNYCAQGRITGAQRVGKTWHIPANATKPLRAGDKHPSTTQPPASPLLQRLMDEKETRTSGGIYHKVQIELTYNSNHIEGSSLTHEQTRFIYETATLGVAEGSVRVDDIVETSNHFRCIDYAIEHATGPLTQSMIKELHRMLKTSTTDAAKDWFAVGDYKRLPNEVGGRATTSPEDVAGAMATLIKSYERTPKHTFEDIVRFHVELERIHPFQDGNGRVGRLVMFKECLRAGIVPFVIDDDKKAFYYRGLVQWDEESGYLIETCRASQDQFKTWLDYFRIPYRNDE